jgi:hypothetical protein
LNNKSFVINVVHGEVVRFLFHVNFHPLTARIALL